MDNIRRRVDDVNGKRNEISVDIHEDKSSVLAATIQDALPEKASPICTIYRVPSKLRLGNERRYEPFAASIGPYHRQTRHFVVTERHKMWYLHNLINRSSPPKKLTDIVEAVRALEVEARDSYAEEIRLDSDEFVTMLTVDGCFILEFFYQHAERKGKETSDEDIDLVFTGHSYVALLLMRDLVLLENQLPFVVLSDLFDLTRDMKHKWSLAEFLKDLLIKEIPGVVIQRDGDIFGVHILDLLGNLLAPAGKIKHNDKYTTSNSARYSATELRKVGVHFKAKENPTSLMDIEFNEQTGVLRIPRIKFDEHMVNLLPNLVAYEQCHPSYSNKFTSYALLLDSLINTEDDVKLLSGKIIDHVASEEVVVKEINSICPGLKIQMFYYEELCHNMNKYCEVGLARIRRYIYIWKTTLKREYLSSPWRIISLVGGILLLGLTLTQTLYSILSYLKT